MNTNFLPQLREVCKLFRIQGELQNAECLTAGNINRTYLVSVSHHSIVKKYIVQRINTYVFQEPANIMHNIELITRHIRAKLTCPQEEQDRYVLHLLNTEEGYNYFISEENEVWRIYPYVENAIAYNSCENPEVLKAAGTAFGKFQTQLADFHAALLYETIPDFHNTALRLKNFFQHVATDEYGRVAEVQKEIQMIRTLQPLAIQLGQMLEAGEIPLRVTHNDTKINNVLIDAQTNQPLAVIDLDTVMPGLAMHDFGDAVRFAANAAAEDEPDLTKVYLDMNRFRAFAEGFIAQTACALTEKEIATMALGAITLTVELAVRFLDDYITGDKYFKTTYPGHNLVRARCQLTLAQDMQRHLEEMNQVIAEIAQKARLSCM